MGRLLDEAIKEAARLQKRLEAVNNNIYDYQNDPNRELEAEKKIQYKAIEEFLELLGLSESLDLPELSEDYLQETLEKYMIDYEYDENVGPEDDRPAVGHEYTFYMKDFQVELGVLEKRYGDDYDSYRRVFFNNEKLDFGNSQISKVLAKKCSNLTTEEIEDYTFIFDVLYDADIDGSDGFYRFER